MLATAMRRVVVVVAAVLGVMLLAACSFTSSARASPSASVAGSFAIPHSTVKVTLQDFAIRLEPYAVVAGQMTFHITNLGSEHVHEFLLLKTDLAGDSLPARPDGSVDEEDKRLKVIAKVGAVPVGESRDLTVSLDGGWYVLVCNMVEGGVVHYPMEKGIPFFVD